MDRRKFLQGIALTAAASGVVAASLEAERRGPTSVGVQLQQMWADASPAGIEGHTRVCEFSRAEGLWSVYEDVRTRDGVMTFVSPGGKALVLTRQVEANFAGSGPLYMGLKLSDIGLTGADLLADALLKHGGDPDPEQVKSIAPPIGSSVGPDDWPPFNTFLGTVECLDTLPVFPSGSTLTYHPSQHFPEIRQALALKRHEGLTGGWMPCPRKVMPAKDGGYYEASLFGEVSGDKDAGKIQFIVQTWHRTVHVKDGTIVKAAYGHSYPAYGPARSDPTAEEFFSAMLDFALYWQAKLHDAVAMNLPDQSYADMARHALVKELMVRPGGVYPKYGAVERAYYGSEYDGFQDIFTSSLYANLEWGRFKMAADVFDNYYTEFVDARGAINMRGPETGQYGMMLSLVAMYLRYTGDAALVLKHRRKIEAIATILTMLHDESLKFAPGSDGYGLIHGWNESDACLSSTPDVWWKPYFANSALAARGFKDISETWRHLGVSTPKTIDDWTRRSEMLRAAVAASVKKNIRTEMKPPYIGPLPGMKLTFWESMKTEKPSEQQWAHRAYAELLQADVLPPDLAHTVIDCMRAYGATTAGVVANVEIPHAEGRNILGFISYGYALELLRLDRIEEYLLFLYSHRFHDHSRGSWMAGEVADITAGTPLFCIPAQLTIPVLVRWMVVLEDMDEERLYFGKGLPRDWVASGKEIAIEQAPTRWGRVDFRMISEKQADGTTKVTADVRLPQQNAPAEIAVKLRVPTAWACTSVSVNGNPARLGGPHRDSVTIPALRGASCQIVACYS
jgi:hypothetical protein